MLDAKFGEDQLSFIKERPKILFIALKFMEIVMVRFILWQGYELHRTS